ncbi:uncharacterized protein LOC123872460 [Maniola jurtina]|uniref:uncharacterized protein LOC123872460 n=1 Tax=Maniola jurtina TaxID=191418 RepID=UPI001E68D2E8|nr:uncharacterized protein LOC123872460 [Maniola jurtina]
MFRLLVLCAILTYVKPFFRHCHTHPPFHGNPCPGIIDTDQDSMLESSEEDSQPYRGHCHTHPPYYGNPCPGINVHPAPDSQQESNGNFQPYRRHCHTHPPFYGNRCPEVTGTSEKPNIETQLQIIEREVTKQDEKFAQFCRENSKLAAELYGTDSYFLKYILPEVGYSKVTIQIVHKFIHTTVTETNGSNKIIFEDVKVVPDIANCHAATWTFHNNKYLQITIPYKVRLGTEYPTTCTVVNNNIIDVPVVLYPGFDYRHNV